jgi:hypothetical protein
MAKMKKYGKKMSNPRIARSKEHRSCGPLGRFLKGIKPVYKIVPIIRTKKRFQVSREALLEYFNLKE